MADDHADPSDTDPPDADPPGADPSDDMLVGYVRGRLSEVEASRISRLAAGRPELAARIALASALAADVDGVAAGPVPGELGWRRISGVLDAEAAPARKGRALWGIAAAAAAMVLVWQLSTVLRETGPGPGYAPVSEQGRGFEISVAFRQDTTEADMRALLRSLDAEVVGGPTAVGLWRLGFTDAAARDEALARLAADEAVESAQAE